MRILLIMDPGIPVPPELYGGIERIVYLLANEYTLLGHEVTLLAGPGSYFDGQTQHFGRNDLSRSKWARFKEIMFVWRYLVRNRGKFDLVHNFGRLIYLLPILNSPIKKLMSYQRSVTARGVALINKMPNKALVFTACSENCVQTGNIAGTWRTVYNGVDFSKYKLTAELPAAAPLIFLGRLDKIKGAHTAIKIAKNTGSRLIIAGNKPDTPDNLYYYEREIEPEFDGKHIIYAGPVDDKKKNEYLGMAKALLFPIEWDEPFGIVMVESMACGTPVIAFRKGSVPEVVNSKTGIIVDNAAEMEKAVLHAGEIDRKSCREDAQKRFDISVIAKEYLNCIGI